MAKKQEKRFWLEVHYDKNGKIVGQKKVTAAKSGAPNVVYVYTTSVAEGLKEATLLREQFKRAIDVAVRSYARKAPRARKAASPQLSILRKVKAAFNRLELSDFVDWLEAQIVSNGG